VLYTVLLGLVPGYFRVWPGVSTVLPALADRPDLRAAACRLFRGIRLLLLLPSWSDAAADGGDACPPSAPAIVVCWVQFMGLLAPLAVAYVIELRARGAFLRARGLQPPAAALNVALGMAAVLVALTRVVWFIGPHLA
jgi:hypothetical protein